ncbi:DNA replication and repair protein RecR [Albimonas donghaensis]|uniref:Recombination protein RecR n=1 Tax=Albimonas donghaensis TaxID=356660 RepID=A0A1H2RGB2_9RHOB|nr:recombination mediator RecR [Albimonas donghaensis]SDW18496.1 DNA replication and repair protein RecR [Albimonas donghaensis]
MHDDDPLGRDDGPAGIGDNSGDESGGEDGRAVERLIELLARLPGLGPRSARRAALHLVRKRDLTLAPLAEAMTEVARTVKPCAECGNISTSGRCGICRDQRRDAATLCVVQDVSDLWAMERGGAFRGRYHVLGGLLSALDGTGPEEIGIPRLAARAREGVTEVILALPATIDGQTTAHYVAESLPEGVACTSLAQGVPIGGELDYLDDGTIGAALRARRAL